MQRFDHIDPGSARRRDAVFFVESCEERLSDALPDPHRPIALHVAVASNAAWARARSADVAPEEKEVHDLLHVLDAVRMLREAEAPKDDHPLGARDHVGDLLDECSLEPAALLDLGQVGPIEARREGVEPARVRSMKS